MATATADINAMVRSGNKRLRGLLSLLDLVLGCSVDVLVEEHEAWETLLIQVLQSHEISVVGKQAAHCIVSALFCRMAVYAELNRHVVASVLSLLVPVLCEGSTELSVSAAECLIKIIPSYHGLLAQHAGRFESFALKLLQSTDDHDAQEKGAELLAVIPACYAGSKRSEIWFALADKVLGSLCNVVNEIYDVLGLEKRLIINATVGFAAGGGLWENATLPDYFHALCHCWTRLLRVQCHVQANVSVGRCLEIVGAIFSFSPKAVSAKVSEKRLSLLRSLPSLHSECCQVLEALVSGVGCYLLPHAAVIARWFVLLLNMWSVNQLPGRIDPHLLPTLRCRVYLAMETWVSTTGGCSLLDTVAGDIVRSAVSDIEAPLPRSATPAAANQTDEASKPPKKKQKKRANEYAATWQSSNAQLVQQVVASGEAAVCHAALSLLQQLVWDIGLMLSVEHYTAALESLIKVTRYLASGSWATDCTSYRSDKCRLAVYDCIVAMATCSYPIGAEYLSEIIFLLTQGRSDVSSAVAILCQRGILATENIFHPRGPPLSSVPSVGSSRSIAGGISALGSVPVHFNYALNSFPVLESQEKNVNAATCSLPPLSSTAPSTYSLTSSVTETSMASIAEASTVTVATKQQDAAFSVTRPSLERNKSIDCDETVASASLIGASEDSAIDVGTVTRSGNNTHSLRTDVDLETTSGTRSSITLKRQFQDNTISFRNTQPSQSDIASGNLSNFARISDGKEINISAAASAQKEHFEEVSEEVAEMLKAFVDAPPDSD